MIVNRKAARHPTLAATNPVVGNMLVQTRAHNQSGAALSWKLAIRP